MENAAGNSAAVLSYRGITLYKVLRKDGSSYTPGKVSAFPDRREGDDEVLDISELEGYQPNVTLAVNLLRMIRAGLLGPMNGSNEFEYKAENCMEGFCPVCGQEIVNYGVQEMVDDSARYPFHCENCGVDGDEWDRLAFDGYMVE